MSRTIAFPVSRTVAAQTDVRTVSPVRGSRSITVIDDVRTVTFQRRDGVAIVRQTRTVSPVRPQRSVSIVQGARGPAGATSDGSVEVAWATPGSEAANVIELSGTVKDANGDLVTSAVDFQVLVSDGAADGEPSSTATITAASSPVGTVLAGSGTASAVIRADAGNFAVAVHESAVGHRYLWVSGAGHERLLVRATDGVQELVFA